MNLLFGLLLPLLTPVSFDWLVIFHRPLEIVPLSILLCPPLLPMEADLGGLQPISSGSGWVQPQGALVGERKEVQEFKIFSPLASFL